MVRYRTFQLRSKPVLLFWQAVQAMPAAQRGKVLKFFTGSARIQVAWMDEAGEQEPPTLRHVCSPSKRRGKSRRAAAGRAELRALNGSTLTGSKIRRNCGGSG